MKTCTKCNEVQDDSKFHKRGNKLYPACRLCTNAYSRIYYKEVRKKTGYIQLENRFLVKRNRKFIYEILKRSKCADCRESDPIVLEFDHVRGTKLNNISNLCILNASLKKLQTEVDKCDVVCSNCRRRRTAQRQNNAKWKYFNTSIV